MSQPFGCKADHLAQKIHVRTFNACLMRDLKARAELQRYALEIPSQEPRIRAIADINIYLLQAPCELAGGSVSKLDTRWSTISGLRDLGRETAERWLTEAAKQIGPEPVEPVPEAAAAS